MNKAFFGIAIALAPWGCSEEEPTLPSDPLDAAVEAMGGEEAIRAVNALRIDASGTSFDGATQGRTPDSDPFQVSTFQSSVLMSLASASERRDWHLETSFLFPAQAYDFSEIAAPQGGFVEGPDGLIPHSDRTPMLPSRISSGRKQDRIASPLTLLQRALAERGAVDTLPDEEFEGRSYHVIAVPDAAAPVRLFIDPESGTIAKADTLEDSPALGDLSYEAVYGDWRPVGSLLVPFEVHERLNGSAYRDQTLSAFDTSPDVAADAFEVPADLAAPWSDELAAWGERSSSWLRGFQMIGLQLYAQQIEVQSIELAPGVVWLAGGTHHSLLVELADHLLLIEAPLYEERSQAVLEAAAQLFPGKPITELVTTHHHHDHAGGVRRVVAEGATLFVGAAVASFFEDMLAAPHTVHPDALAQSDAIPEVIAVDAKLVLGDATREVQVLPLPNSHADAMLAVWLPAEGILFESDLYSPGLFPPGNAGEFAVLGSELLDWVNGEELAVQTFVGGHGLITGTLTDLQGVAGR